jgi:hypothetical protein
VACDDRRVAVQAVLAGDKAEKEVAGALALVKSARLALVAAHQTWSRDFRKKLSALRVMHFGQRGGAISRKTYSESWCVRWGGGFFLGGVPRAQKESPSSRALSPPDCAFLLPLRPS